ncbi:ABC transporter ATP-binding protein [Actinoplanes sp. NPDC024001]|uniref:ABC transporter ATP-binding protein n=1 Tax=Actinoplanes sp. NPDC024001 TaxID=3154598 RepID=UPI0033D0A598
MAEVAGLSDEPDERAVFRRAWPFLRGHRGVLGTAVVLNLLNGAVAAGVLALVGRVADAVVAGDRAALLRALLALAVATAVGGSLVWSARYWLVRAGEHAVRRLRDRAVAAVASAPLRFVEVHRRGDLLHRCTGEINELAAFAGGTLPELVTAGVMLAFTGALLFAYSGLLTLLLLVTFLPVAVLIVRRFRVRSGPAFAAMAAARRQVAGTFAEILPATEQLRVSGAAGRWLERFGREQRGLLGAERGRLRAGLVLHLLTPYQSVCVAALLVAGAVLAGRGRLSVGVLVVFVLAARDIFHRFEDLAAALGEAREARTYLARVLDLIAAAGTPATATGAALPARGELVLDQVTFRYAESTPAVDGVSLRIPAGERLAIVGETGSGKSTLGKLLAGLYPPDAGRLTFAGHDLTAADPAQVRSRMVLVPQDVHLVDGTLLENVTMVPGAPGPERVTELLDRLGLAGWAAGLPDGPGTRVGPRGSALSAGERQIVAILRAALTDPAVLILDEATADVDPATAAVLETALSALAGDRTVVVIAHRAGTIARAGRVVELSGGRLG